MSSGLFIITKRALYSDLVFFNLDRYLPFFLCIQSVLIFLKCSEVIMLNLFDSFMYIVIVSNPIFIPNDACYTLILLYQHYIWQHSPRCSFISQNPIIFMDYDILYSFLTKYISIIYPNNRHLYTFIDDYWIFKP